MKGRVYLVGAGPGDPGLLTLRGKQCLERADVVIYDYLANPRLLDHAPREAQRILVGKHGGGERVEQDVIHSLLIDHARRGHTVVRLKGGDPFIFGRGGEEAAVVRAAGFEFEVVPGVSAAIAVPAYAGIPLTHRDLASNVIFTTGYEYPNKDTPAVRWQDLARTGSTLVLLMSTRQLGTNMRKLRDGGLPPHTPVAVIEWGTRAAQRTVVGTGETIADLAEEAGLRPPAIVVVGAVVALREQLQWVERKPLFGKRIVMTRPRHQLAELAEALDNLGAETLSLPTIEIVPTAPGDELDDALARAASFDWLILTSANGVRIFFDRLRHAGRDIRDWHRAKIAAIGPQTAKALTEHGLRVDVVPDQYRAEGLLASLGATGISGKRVLLPRAAGARDILPLQLRGLGAEVEEVATYRAESAPIRDTEVGRLLQQNRIDLVTFTSSSTVHGFVEAAGGDLDLSTVPAACIGPITAATARDYGMKVAVEAVEFTVPGLVKAIETFFGTAER